MLACQQVVFRTIAGVFARTEPVCDTSEVASSIMDATRAGMAELADAADSKSAEGNLVGVRPPLPAPMK